MRERQRRATIMIANRYRKAFVRHQERTFANEITAKGELREKMEALLDEFVGGAKPDRIHRKGSDYDPAAGTMMEHKVTGKKGRRRTYSHVPRPMKPSDVITMKLHDRDVWHNDHDADGKPFRTFVRITTVDGGQVDFFEEKVKPPTKKQLLAKAKDLGVEGLNSKHTIAEITAAIEGKE